MARDIKSDLVAFLREHFNESEIPVTFEAGDPADPTTVEASGSPTTTARTTTRKWRSSLRTPSSPAAARPR